MNKMVYAILILMISNGLAFAQENLILKSDTSQIYYANIGNVTQQNNKDSLKNKNNINPAIPVTKISNAEKAWLIAYISSTITFGCGFLLWIGSESERQRDFGQKMVLISCPIYCISSLVVMPKYLKKKPKQTKN